MSIYVKQISLWSNTHQYTYTHRHTFRLMVKYGCWILCFSLHVSVLVTLLKAHVLFTINNYWIIFYELFKNFMTVYLTGRGSRKKKNTENSIYWYTENQHSRLIYKDQLYVIYEQGITWKWNWEDNSNHNSITKNKILGNIFNKLNKYLVSSYVS